MTPEEIKAEIEKAFKANRVGKFKPPYVMIVCPECGQENEFIYGTCNYVCDHLLKRINS